MEKTNLSTRILIWRLRNRGNQTLILSGLIGVFSGLAAVVLKRLVHGIQKFLTEDFYTEYGNFMYIIQY